MKYLCIACILLGAGVATAQEETVTIPKSEYESLQKNMRQGCVLRAAGQIIARAALAEGVLPQTAIGFSYTTFTDELRYLSIEKAEWLQEIAMGDIPLEIERMMQRAPEGQDPTIIRELEDCRSQLAFARQ